MLQTGSPFVYASAGQSDRPVDMMVDASGLIYLSGESGYGSEQGLFVLQLNSDLTQSWVRTYKSTDGDGDHAGLLTSVPGGGVVLHGANHNGSGLEYYLVNYSADGTQLFVAADSDEYCFWDPSWWISGRWYKKTDTPPTTWYALGFLAGTSVSLVERTEGDYSFFPESFGDMTAYYFYDPTAHETTGAYVTLDNGLKGEAVFSGGDPDNVQLTKVIDPDGNTYWLLWGTNVYVGHDDVVIEKTAANEWTAYTFDRTATTIDELSQSMSLIGPVANPESLVLPGLGDWQTYCDAHGITVEYPSPSA